MEGVLNAFFFFFFTITKIRCASRAGMTLLGGRQRRDRFVQCLWTGSQLMIAPGAQNLLCTVAARCEPESGNIEEVKGVVTEMWFIIKSR